MSTRENIRLIARAPLCYMPGQIYVIRKAKFMLYERPNLCYMQGQIYVN